MIREIKRTVASGYLMLVVLAVAQLLVRVLGVHTGELPSR